LPRVGALLLDLADQDALSAQGGLDVGVAAGAHFALDGLAGLVRAFPGEIDFLDFSGRSSCHYSLTRMRLPETKEARSLRCSGIAKKAHDSPHAS